MNACYTKDFEVINKERYIDTSSIMDHVRLQKYISKNKSQLISNNIKIVVCKEVHAELCKHIKSRSRQKQKQASKGLDIIKNNLEIFDLEDCCENKNIKDIFADKALLALMLSNRTNRSQMLITNDRNLAYDARNLKYLESVSGGAIYTKYIDKEGELKDYPTIEETNLAFTNNEYKSSVEIEQALSKEFIKGTICATALVTTSYLSVKYNVHLNKGVQKIIKEFSSNFYKLINI